VDAESRRIRETRSQVKGTKEGSWGLCKVEVWVWGCEVGVDALPDHTSGLGRALGFVGAGW
jgi:hypothetical protein